MISRRKLIRASAGLIAAPFVLRLPRARASGNLVINPSFDAANWGSAPAAVTNGLAAAISQIEALVAIPVTINLKFGYGACAPFISSGDVTGLAFTDWTEATTVSTNYTAVRNALIANAKTTEATNAIAACVPSSDPIKALDASATWRLTGAHAVLLGLLSTSAILGYTAITSSFTPFYPSGSPVANAYDATSVFMHEITESLGRVFIASNFASSYGPLDLFRWASSGTRAIGSTGSYFSIDGGITNINDFWSNPSTADAYDWSGNTPDSFNGRGTLGASEPLSAGDQTLMDAIGWSAANTGQQTFGFVQ